MAVASRDILNFRDLEMAFPGVVKRYTVISTADTMLFHHNTCKTGNNAVEMSQAYFHDFAQFKRFTDRHLFKYAFNVISKLNAVQFYSMVLIFC